MMSVAQCALTALASDELIVGVTPTERHRKLLASYLLSAWRGPAGVRNMIVFDLRCFLDLGVSSRAADLLIVLRLFLSGKETDREQELFRAVSCGQLRLASAPQGL